MKVFILLFFISVISYSKTLGNSEYALGGGTFALTKSNKKSLDPADGYFVRLQNGNGEATYFNLVNNLDFAISGQGVDDFKDNNGDDVNNATFNMYLIDYSIGFRLSTAPNSPIMPYLGANGIISVATFQFKNKTSDTFPNQQRGFMYGYDLYLGLDIFFEGDKDKGWGLRAEYDIMKLSALSSFVMGSPEINSTNIVLMFVVTY